MQSKCFEWNKTFKEGQILAEDDIHTGWLTASVTGAECEEVGTLI